MIMKAYFHILLLTIFLPIIMQAQNPEELIKLGKEALENVKEQLRTELQSDEFTTAAKDMLNQKLS